MSFPLTRRSFLHLSAASAAAAWASACQSTFPRRVTKGPLRYAAVGVKGMGEWDLKNIASHPDVRVECLCDVDESHLMAAAALHPEARLYRDWREMLRVEAGKLDGISVSIPDHMHAPVVMTALGLGMHVYGQKPLTHTVVEARTLRAAARKAGVATQMGIQNHSAEPYRTALRVFEGGITGPVSEVHVWTDRPAGWWPQDVDRPEGSDPVPANLDWDLWLGVAPERPYKEGAYHAFVWRGRKDFGTGAQGDMACHLMDPALWFLGLGDPFSVLSEGPKPKADSYPLWSRIVCEFEPTSKTAQQTIPVTWHDGGRQPSEPFAAYGVEKPYGNGSFFVGDKGALMVSPYDPCRFFQKGQGEVALTPEPVEGIDHWHQWVDACLGRGETTCGFDYAGRLSELALLGNVALEFPGERLAWESSKLRFAGRPDASALLHKTYRPGWEVDGL
ncbi:MAG: Gfo/Idh/MocA family oxidoreductase [Planctomycetes bacterium]|nr:Gfo/Idh/MocA family oxidoreductase [Planctomycetota bacterium]